MNNIPEASNYSIYLDPITNISFRGISIKCKDDSISLSDERDESRFLIFSPMFVMIL